MNLELSDEQAAALERELTAIIDGDRYFLSPRFRSCITASVVQFAAKQTHNLLLISVAAAMWFSLVILSSSALSISVFIGVSRQDGFPATWYWTALSLFLSLAISGSLLWMCETALSSAIADSIKAAHQ
jgi:hypothetical protein